MTGGQGKPGQDVLWPGEFVFGYPAQRPGAPERDAGPKIVRESPGQPDAG